MKFSISSLRVSLSISSKLFFTVFLVETPASRQKSCLHGRAHVGLRSPGKKGNLPPLVLHGHGDADGRSEEKVRAYRAVILCSASGQKPAVHLAMAQTNPSFAFRAQPVVAANFFRLRGSANAGANQFVVACIRIQVVMVLIETPDMTSRESWRHRGAAFQPQIKLRQGGDIWEVQTCLEYGFPGVADRRDFVLGKSVSVKSQPVSQLGNTVGEIHSNAGVTEVIKSPACASEKEYTLQEFMKGERCAFSPEDICFRDAEFQVPREMETHFLSVKERLRVERLSELPESDRARCRVHGHELVARKLPGERFDSNVTKNSQTSGQPEGRVAADAKHGDGLGVIAEQKRATFVWPPPETQFSEGARPMRHFHLHIASWERIPTRDDHSPARLSWHH